MAKLVGSIKVDIQKCKGCDLCVVACPLDVITLSKDANTKGYNFAHMVNLMLVPDVPPVQKYVLKHV